MRLRRRALTIVAACAAVAAAGCGSRRPSLPSGAGTPFADAPAAYTAATQECRGVRTIRATLGLSGKAGSTTLRGNVDAGFEAPERVRLEGRHPLGRPVFILVATGKEATLYFPRDNRVLRNVGPTQIVEALVGLPLSPAELRSLVSGCGFGAGEASGGRSYPGGWVAVDSGGAVTYLRQIEGRWRVVAAARAPLAVHYSTFVGGRASTLRLRATSQPAADVGVRLSDLNINVTLEPEVFQVDVPSGAEPLTIDELRRAGPLGGQ